MTYTACFIDATQPRRVPALGGGRRAPRVCEVAEALVAEFVGLPVLGRCERGESPKCCFEIGDEG